MCLAVPARVKEILDDEQAVVDLGGVSKTISIALVDNVQIDDYVIVHTGYALNKIDTEEALKTLKLFEELGYDVDTGAA